MNVTAMTIETPPGAIAVRRAFPSFGQRYDRAGLAANLILEMANLILEMI
jgi:hypothetical protein